MRQVRVAVALGVLWSGSSQAQPADSLWVSMSAANMRASVVATAEPNTTGPPHASIAAVPADGRSAAECDWFRIRAWKEADGARVIVTCVTRDPSKSREPAEDRETQIATTVLRMGESHEVTETARYGARPVMLEATGPPPIR